MCCPDAKGQSRDCRDPGQYVGDGQYCLFSLGPGDGDLGPKVNDADHVNDKGTFVFVPSCAVGVSVPILAPERGEREPWL